VALSLGCCGAQPTIDGCTCAAHGPNSKPRRTARLSNAIPLLAAAVLNYSYTLGANLLSIEAAVVRAVANVAPSAPLIPKSAVQ
jgi:hypothetical protein